MKVPSINLFAALLLPLAFHLSPCGAMEKPEVVLHCEELLQTYSHSTDLQQQERALKELRQYIQSNGTVIYNELFSYLEHGVNSLFVEMNHRARGKVIADLNFLDLIIRQSPPSLREAFLKFQGEAWVFIFDTAHSEVDAKAYTPERWGKQFSNDILAMTKMPRMVVMDLIPKIRNELAHTSGPAQQLLILHKIQNLARSASDLVQQAFRQQIRALVQKSTDKVVIDEAIYVMQLSSSGQNNNLHYLADLLEGPVANPYAQGQLARVLLSNTSANAAFANPTDYQNYAKKILQLVLDGKFNSALMADDDLTTIFTAIEKIAEPHHAMALRQLASTAKNPALRGYAAYVLAILLKKNDPAALTESVNFFIQRLTIETTKAKTGKAFFHAAPSILGALRVAGPAAQPALPLIENLLFAQTKDGTESRLLLATIKDIAGNEIRLSQAAQFAQRLRRLRAEKSKPMDFKFTSISVAQLKQKIDRAWKNHEFYDSELPQYSTLTDLVALDLETVKFDSENISADDFYGHIGMAPIGYVQLNNGMTFLGVNAGGDWEIPLYFIIYWDGHDLRGYIPQSGNPWNTDTKQAYGNDGENNYRLDQLNLKKRYPELFSEVPLKQIDPTDKRIEIEDQKILAELESKFSRRN